MTRPRSAVCLTIAAILFASPQALAQVRTPKDKDKTTQGQPGTNNPSQKPASTPTPPTAPPAGPKPELIEPGPYIVQEMPKEWTVRARVRVTSKAPGLDAQILSLTPGRSRDDNAVTSGNAPGFNFQTMTVVFPIAPMTAGATPHDDAVTGWLKVDDREVATNPRLTKKSAGNYPGGTRLIQFTTRTGSNSNEVPDGNAREVEMQVDIPMTCARTRFDEKSASEVDWPKGDWPAVVKSVFQPQIYVETYYDGAPYDLTRLKELVKNWTNGDPKSVRPVVLAKALAAEIVRAFQPTGDSRATLRTGELQGFALDGVEQTALTGRGSEFDIACLTTAAYRIAGLPARLVIGVEAEDVDKKNFLDSKRSGRGKFRAWVEFALFDEVNNTLNWIPVDIVKIRKQSSRPQPLDRAWKYFGTHDELNLITPIALQFHPPTTVIAYSVPGLWGWMVTPNPPSTAYQALYFDAYRTSSRPADPRDKNNKKNGNK